jgi:uncharacterized protein
MTMRRREFLKAGALLAAGCAIPDSGGGRDWVVDCHCHAGRGMNYGKDGAAPWTTFNSPERTLRRMEQAGIDRTVIFPITNTTYEEANEEIASYVKKWPDKFIGFAKHDQKSEAGRIRALLTREVKELGLKGLKLHGAPTREMLEVVDDLCVPILCHPARVADLAECAQAWPRIRFILAHLGSFASRDWAEHRAAIGWAGRLPNLYLDTSSVVFQEYLEQAARELPAEKLLFGTDGPLLDSRVELNKIRLLDLPKDRERLVLGDNILRILAG